MCDQLKDILKAHNLSITPCRLRVLELFMMEDAALTQRDLEKKLVQHDRVTLYRTLNSFLAAGIIHKIPNSEGVATYGRCQDSCAPDHHHHDHVHFKCINCGQIQCLDDQPIPKITLPEGYMIESANLIVDGLCVKCS
jgi:Fur family ferric uptake transcriptional regulator